MAHEWPVMGVDSRYYLLTVCGRILSLLFLSRMLKIFSVYDNSNTINKLLARSIWPDIMMVPCAGQHTVYGCTENFTLHPDLYGFATDNILDWSEFAWKICDSIVLYRRGQLMFPCN